MFILALIVDVRLSSDFLKNSICLDPLGNFYFEKVINNLLCLFPQAGSQVDGSIFSRYC